MPCFFVGGQGGRAKFSVYNFGFKKTRIWAGGGGGGGGVALNHVSGNGYV